MEYNAENAPIDYKPCNVGHHIQTKTRVIHKVKHLSLPTQGAY